MMPIYTGPSGNRRVSAGGHHPSMDDQRIGYALRAIRQRKRFRQVDVAKRAGTSQTMVARIERGAVSNVPFGMLQRLALELDARLDVRVRWQGGDLDRLVNARHAGMHEVMARWFASLDGWSAEPEVSFSVYGERGVIDIAAWHAVARHLLIVELKTELVDVNELLATLDRKRRLGSIVARDRGMQPLATSSWVVLADSRTNRRAVSSHAAVLRSKLPTDGRTMRSWLVQPTERVDALSFLPSTHSMTVRRDLAPLRRVAGRDGDRHHTQSP
jgi:transcriptional regulator with XRE-family HTH domain